MAAASKIRDISLLSNLVPLNELDHEKLLELADGASVLQFAKGQSVSSGVEKAYIAYVIAGDVTLSPHSPQSERVTAGGARARHAILAPDNRCRVVAESAATVLCIDSEILDLLSNWGASNGFVVDEIDAGDSGDWLDSLMQSDAVLSLSSSGIQSIMAAIDPVEIKAGELIFNQGDAPDYYHIISRGRCVITRRASEQDAPTELAVLGPGDAFGEEALIADTRRSASARMSEDGLLLRIDQTSFKRLLEQPLVNTVDPEQASSLRAAGAQLLDIRPAAEFVSEEGAINIPFSALRSRVGSLDKSAKYIIVSDDNRTSAVAAFLLGQKQFSVDVLKIPGKEEIAAQKFQAVIDSLEKKLLLANTRLQQEERGHQATRSKNLSLETELKSTQASARKAILEASALKSQFELDAGKKIEALSLEAASARRDMQSLVDEKKTLEGQLDALKDELQQALREAENTLPETVLTDVISDNEQQLEIARLGQEQLLAENQALNQQLADARQTHQQYIDELQQLRRHYEQTLEEKESLSLRLNHDSASVEQHEEQLAHLQDSYTQTVSENKVLSDQLDEARQDAEQQAAQLAELRLESEQRCEQINSLQQDYEQLQQKNQHLGEQLADMQQTAVQRENAFEQLQQKREQLSSEKRLLREKLEEVNASADQYRQALEQQTKAHEQLQQTLDAQIAKTEAPSSTRHNEHVDALKRENEQLEEEKLFFNTLLEELKETLEKQEEELNGLRKELSAVREQSQGQSSSDGDELSRIRSDRDALQKKNNLLREQMAEKDLAFDGVEQNYKKHIARLEKDLEQELINSSNTLEQIGDDLSKEKQRADVLHEELSLAWNEGRRGRRWWVWLLAVMLVLAAAAGGVHYMDVGVSGQARMLLN